jgi:calcium/calmodulin-dependent protein kinase I
MAGSFGYTAPEVLLNYGHGKPVDIWSLGIITYTLLCGYLPFRSKHVQGLIEECSTCRVVFHEKHWKDVSDDAKHFILKLLRPKPQDRLTSEVSGYPPLVVTTYGNALVNMPSPSSKPSPTPGCAARPRRSTTCCPRCALSTCVLDCATASKWSSWPTTSLLSNSKGAVFHEAVPAKLREMKELEQTLKEDGAAQEGSTEGIKILPGIKRPSAIEARCLAKILPIVTRSQNPCFLM